MTLALTRMQLRVIHDNLGIWKHSHCPYPRRACAYGLGTYQRYVLSLGVRPNGRAHTRTHLVRMDTVVCQAPHDVCDTHRQYSSKKKDNTCDHLITYTRDEGAHNWGHGIISHSVGSKPRPNGKIIFTGGGYRQTIKETKIKGLIKNGGPYI